MPSREQPRKGGRNLFDASMGSGAQADLFDFLGHRPSLGNLQESFHVTHRMTLKHCLSSRDYKSGCQARSWLFGGNSGDSIQQFRADTRHRQNLRPWRESPKWLDSRDIIQIFLPPGEQPRRGGRNLFESGPQRQVGAVGLGIYDLTISGAILAVKIHRTPAPHTLGLTS